MPTLLVFTSPPADHAVPQKLVWQKIARSAAHTERPEPVPAWNAPASALLRFPASPPVRVMGLAPLCTVHISANRAQACTNEESPQVPRPRITPTNNYYLEGIGFEPQNRRATRPIRYPSVQKRKPPRLRLASSGRTGVRISAAPPGARSSHQFVLLTSSCFVFCEENLEPTCGQSFGEVPESQGCRLSG